MARKENEQLSGHTDLIEATLIERDGVQYRFSVTEFRDVQYLSIREWYLDFDEEWMPSRNGFTMPYTIDSTAKMFSGLVSLLSEAEMLTTLLEYIDDPSKISRTSD